MPEYAGVKGKLLRWDDMTAVGLAQARGLHLGQLFRPNEALPSSAPSFQDMGQRGRQGLAELLWPSVNLHSQLMQLQHKVAGGATFTPRDLLLYQIRAGQLHLQVELVSKAAESMLATVRKFQNLS